MPLPVREILRIIFSFGQTSVRATRWYLPTPGRSHIRKKERKKPEHWKPVKDKYNLNYFPSPILIYWEKKRDCKDSISPIIKFMEWTLLQASVRRLRHFSQVREKERKKKEKEEKNDCERHFCLMFSCWLNIFLYCKKEKRKEKKLFLKSHHYLFGCRLLKFRCTLNAPLCWNLLVVLLPLSICLLLHISVSA